MSENYDHATDEELYEYLKTLPEFEKLLFPKAFVDKFNIKQKQFSNFKECLEENYSAKCMYAPNKEPGIIDIKTPVDYKFPELKADEVPLEIQSKEITTS